MGSAPMSPQDRDRALRRYRVFAWGVGLTAAGATAALSVAAAHAFKGHDGSSAAAPAARTSTPGPRASVPGPQHIPSVSGDNGQLSPPAQTPSPAPSAPSAAPSVSGGS
jgi:hypothetical protein